MLLPTLSRMAMKFATKTGVGLRGVPYVATAAAAAATSTALLEHGFNHHRAQFFATRGDPVYISSTEIDHMGEPTTTGTIHRPTLTSDDDNMEEEFVVPEIARSEDNVENENSDIMLSGYLEHPC